MYKYLIKLSLFITLTFVGCEEKATSIPRKRKGPGLTTSLPDKGTKIAFIFPAGAGAMRVILGITEKLEEDLGVDGLASVIDAAGGVSSGSIVAAALTIDKTPKITSKMLKAELGKLVRNVFPHVNDLVDKLITTYGFTLSELEIIFGQVMTSPPRLSSQIEAEADFENIIENAAKDKSAIISKVKRAKGNVADFIAAISGNITFLLNFSGERAQLLGDNIKSILGDSDLLNAKNNKFLSYASSNAKPVFFGAPHLSKFVSGPYAVGTTKVYEALVASSAIPQFIKAPADINFTLPDGSTQNINNLIDGVFATEERLRFDPSATFYEAFKKQFANENVLIVYVGNGARRDRKFRGMLTQKYGLSAGIAQETTAQGKKITFVAIDAKIKDDDGNDIFYLSGFYDSEDLERYMDFAAEEAVKSLAYDWALKAIKASLQ